MRNHEVIFDRPTGESPSSLRLRRYAQRQARLRLPVATTEQLLRGCQGGASRQAAAAAVPVAVPVATTVAPSTVASVGEAIAAASAIATAATVVSPLPPPPPPSVAPTPPSSSPHRPRRHRPRHRRRCLLPLPRPRRQHRQGRSKHPPLNHRPQLQQLVPASSATSHLSHCWVRNSWLRHGTARRTS